LAFLVGMPAAQAFGKKQNKDTVLCEGFTLRGHLDPGLSGTEKKLICGSDLDAWQKIPFPQARYDLTNFLQDRGYLHPIFIEDNPSERKRRYTVDVGQQTRVSSLSADGAPDSLEIGRKRLVVGEILTPKLLGNVEQWVYQRLQTLGYACPTIKSEADPDNGVIVVHVEPGPFLNLNSVIEETIPGVEPGTLRRYDAFRLGKPFNGDLLTVTSNRITSLNILQSNHFSTRCEKDGVVAHEEVTPGPPRLLTFGAGVDTEGLIQLRASWRNARLGLRASLAEVSTQVSTKDQSVNALFNWYFLPYTSRKSVQPQYQVRHQNEDAYEVISTQVKVLGMTTWDNQSLGAQFAVGPALDLIRTFRGSGSGDPNAEFLAAETSLRVRSHDFEYWATDPRTGYTAALTTDLTPGGALSKTSSQRFNFNGEALLNLKNYDPPLMILGARWGAATTLSGERPGVDSRLPATYFWYLGGSADLRGFSRQSVPAFGAMTALYLDPEIRLAGVLPFGIQPVFFTDFGLVGSAPVSVDSPLLYSPGFGIRYKSPIGVFRTTLARGFPINTPGGWNFYLSFGEEF
jgi:translocation and assembly module TamA